MDGGGTAVQIAEACLDHGCIVDSFVVGSILSVLGRTKEAVFEGRQWIAGPKIQPPEEVKPREIKEKPASDYTMSPANFAESQHRKKEEREAVKVVDEIGEKGQFAESMSLAKHCRSYVEQFLNAPEGYLVKVAPIKGMPIPLTEFAHRLGTWLRLRKQTSTFRWSVTTRDGFAFVERLPALIKSPNPALAMNPQVSVAVTRPIPIVIEREPVSRGAIQATPLVESAAPELAEFHEACRLHFCTNEFDGTREEDFARHERSFENIEELGRKIQYWEEAYRTARNLLGLSGDPGVLEGVARILRQQQMIQDDIAQLAESRDIEDPAFARLVAMIPEKKKEAAA